MKQIQRKYKPRHFLPKKHPADTGRPVAAKAQSKMQCRQEAAISLSNRRIPQSFLDPATSRYLQITYGNRAVLRQQKSMPPEPRRISRPGDSDEQQAARMADRIVQAADDGGRRSDFVSYGSPASELQREPVPPSAAGQQNKPAERASSRPPAVGLSDSGVPLDDYSRTFFEPRFGRDFSGVRIHRDARAAKAAAGLNARAFTTGDDIYFGRDEYAPQTGAGKKLLAHELTHVVQQRRGIATPTIQREVATPSAEAQAAALLTGATDLLSASPPHAPLPGIRQLMQESGNVMANFFPSGYGVLDSNGRVTRASTRTDLYTTVRSGSMGVGMPFEFRVYVYLSHETGGAAAGRYVPQGNLGGRIIFYINHITGVAVDEVAELMAHELFHMWAHAQRVMRERFGDEAAGQLPNRAAARILDPGRFSAQRRTMRTHFTSLIGYLDAEQRRRGALIVGRSVSERADRWADLVVEEVGAYVYGVCAMEAIVTEQTRRTAASTGAPAVGIGSFFDAVSFLRNYIRNHWLQDPDDRTALDQPRGRSLLAGMRDDILALKSAVESYIGCRRTR